MEFQPNITLSTCWYELKCKFKPSVYMEWIDNMLSTVNSYNLVIYSDDKSSICLKKYLTNPKIKLIIKDICDFNNYKYKDYFIKNNSKNILLNSMVEWKVNLLWSEKTNFVYETMKNKYFDSEYYGWCDIGYFRQPNPSLINWPDPYKIDKIDKTVIYYTCVYFDRDRMHTLMNLVKNKNSSGLPAIPIPPEQNSIAGGFFISHMDNIEWWKNEFEQKLQLYFDNNYLVKDDQIIIVDCVFSNMARFKLLKENQINDENWFLFKKFLM